MEFPILPRNRGVSFGDRREKLVLQLLQFRQPSTPFTSNLLLNQVSQLISQDGILNVNQGFSRFLEDRSEKAILDFSNINNFHS